MAQTPEGKIKDAIKKVLRECEGAYWHCPMQNGMGAPSLDFICCIKGRYFAIEAKAPGKKPTERQQITMKQITDAGGVVITVDSMKAVEELSTYILAIEVLGR